MPYTVVPNRANPTCQVFLIDQSKSMDKPFGRQAEKKKSVGVADVVNRALVDLVIKCTKHDGIRDFVYVGVIGYGEQVGSALGGALTGRTLVPIHEIASSPLRLEDRTKTEDDGMGGLTQKKIKFPIWVEPKAEGMTPLARALELARDWIAGFINAHPNCLPPVVINVTDGQPTEIHPKVAAAALRELASSDGNVLLFNIHLSDKANRTIEYPSDNSELPDSFAKMLFDLSSVLPAPFVTAAIEEGYPVTAGSRGFVFNGDLVAATRFISFGTQQGQPRNTNPGSQS